MHPAALLWPRIVVVPGVKVGHQAGITHIFEQTTNNRLTTTVVILIVANALRPRCRENPDIPVLAVLPPACLITVNDRTLSDLLLEILDRLFGCRPYAVRQFDDLTCTQPQTVQGLQICL